MDTLEPPVFVIVSESFPVLPTFTLPKLRLVGFALRAPAVTATPFPEIGTVKLGLLAVEVMVRFPLAEPAAPGANDTVKVALSPLLSVTGVVIPLRLNPVPVTPTCVTDTLEPPVFVMVSESFPVLPTFTLPKLKVAGFALRKPAAIASPVPDNGIEIFELTASELMMAAPVT
jgi:hypothetical protein